MKKLILILSVVILVLSGLGSSATPEEKQPAFEIDQPILVIKLNGGIGINIDISNIWIHPINITNIELELNGLIIPQNTTVDPILDLQPGESETRKVFVLGFGPTKIELKVTVDPTLEFIEEKIGFIFLVFTIFIP